jgi:hypothetical protein
MKEIIKCKSTGGADLTKMLTLQVLKSYLLELVGGEQGIYLKLTFQLNSMAINGEMTAKSSL